MAARLGGLQAVNEYEQKRLDRIAANQAKLDSMGVLQQKASLEDFVQAVRRTVTASKAPKVKGLTPATRHSQRLQKVDAEHTCLVESANDCSLHQGKVAPTESGGTGNIAARLCSNERRCVQKGRGSIYDNVAGITCHFCRQKKLCGEEDCSRCSERDVEQACIGKSECSRCELACGRFCRACLLVRYGLKLEAVREEMAAGTWLCPHCYEEDHPQEDWICNSSICMTRRGLKPTGIAIFEAQQQGFASVAHFVQAQLAGRKGRQLVTSTSAPVADAPAPAAAPVLLARTHSGSTTESDVGEAETISSEAVSQSPVLPEPGSMAAVSKSTAETVIDRSEQPEASAVSTAALQLAPPVLKPSSPGHAAGAVEDCTYGPVAGNESQTASLASAAAKDTPAGGKDTCSDLAFADQVDTTVETRHAGKQLGQESVAEVDRASAAVQGGKNACISIYDHGLMTVETRIEGSSAGQAGAARQDRPKHKRTTSGTKGSGILGFVVPVRRSARHA